MRKAEVVQVPCDGGWSACDGQVTHIGSKGYAYCTPCAQVRRGSGYENVRKLTPAEYRQIVSGQPIKAY